MEHKTLHLEVKDLNEEGVFDGFLSVYSIVDHGGEVVEPGAANKSISDQGGSFPLLAHHKSDEFNIGALKVKDSSGGIQIEKGTLNLDLQDGRDALSVMRFNKAHNIKTALSIGYFVLQDEVKKGIRYLKEIKLMEGSLVTFGMNPKALVGNVKQLTELQVQEFKSFSEELQNLQTWALRSQLMDALYYALENDVFYPGMEVSKSERISRAQRILADFSASFLSYLPSRLDLMGVKSNPFQETKCLSVVSPQEGPALKAMAESILALFGPDGILKEAAAGAKGAAAEPDKPGVAHLNDPLKAEFKELFQNA